MMPLKQARNYAANMAALHGEPWLVFRTPDSAPCNQHPGNVHNTGRYHCCAASERADYEAGGAVFVPTGEG